MFRKVLRNVDDVEFPRRELAGSMLMIGFGLGAIVVVLAMSLVSLLGLY